MRAFLLSDFNSPNENVTALTILLEGDAIDYYHSLTKQVQDDWYKLMRVLGQRYDCVSHELEYLSRMLTLKENNVPGRANYVREFRTCVIKSKVSVGKPQMGYLANSRFIKGLSNPAEHREYIVEVRSRWRSVTPFYFNSLLQTIAEAYMVAGYQLREVQNASSQLFWK